MTARLAGSLLLVAVLLSGAAGCKGTNDSADTTGAPTGAPVSTSTVEASTTAPGTEAVDTTTRAEPVDTAAIEKELAAIDKELDALSMPDDSEFSAIEGDLP